MSLLLVGDEEERVGREARLGNPSKESRDVVGVGRRQLHVLMSKRGAPLPEAGSTPRADPSGCEKVRDGITSVSASRSTCGQASCCAFRGAADHDLWSAYLLPSQNMASRRDLKVAVVDDNVDTVEALTALLRGTGFSASSFSRGHDFLTSIASTPFAAVVLDLAMPEIGGLEVLRILREELRSPVPVIICSAHAGPTELAMLRKLGVDAVIRKPMDIDALVRSVERVTAGS